MAWYDNPDVCKFSVGMLCVVVLLWFITSCVDIANFDESRKQTDDGLNTSGWSTTISMFALSLIAVFVILGAGVFFTVKASSATAVAAAAAV